VGARVRSPLVLRSMKAFCLLRDLPRSAGWIERVRSCAGADRFLLASMSVPMKPFYWSGRFFGFPKEDIGRSGGSSGYVDIAVADVYSAIAIPWDRSWGGALI
jgi:hypothetical protein